MKPILYFLAGLILICGGYFGGKLFEKPQVINSFSFPAQNQKAPDFEDQLHKMRVQQELRDLEVNRLLERIQDLLVKEHTYHHSDGK